MSNDVYQIITDQILAKLESGTIPWRKPWSSVKASGGTRPRNLEGRCYSGSNWFLLGMLDYQTPIFGTYKMIQAAGGQVRKGEKGIPVVYWKMLDCKDEKEPSKVKKVPMLRYYMVFNVEQCDGLNLPEPEPMAPFDPIQDAEAIWNRYAGKPSLKHGGDRACYIPALDSIHLPEPGTFIDPASYYNTLFHEMGHSTGHESRLNRELSQVQEKYSREELIAELSAAFLSAQCGLDSTLDQSAAYIANWLGFLKSDPKAFVLAAGKAQKAADRILGITKTESAIEAA